MNEQSGHKGQVWSVGALCRAFADALDARFNPLVVRGEISGFSKAASGHCYFVVKDGAGQLRCAMFRRAASMLNFNPRDGDHVELHARVSVYEPRGELQLVVDAMRHAGQGSLHEQFIQLKEKLGELGLFDPARKRPIASVPVGVGLVTSLGAAALHDVVTALRRRVPHIPVVIAPSLVQGEGAAANLISSLHALYAMAVDPQAEVKIDTILLVRGGGSLEDLWSFNDENLAHTIAQSPVPLVSGVGHETDFTIADFVADLRAPTPTAAAELVASPTQDLLEQLSNLDKRRSRSMQRSMEQATQGLDSVWVRLARPSHFVHQRVVQLQSMEQRLQSAVRTRVTRAQATLRGLATALMQSQRMALTAHQSHQKALSTRLESQNPRNVLGRGYAWLASTEGVAVVSIDNIHRGQAIRATLVDGTVEMTVQSIRPN